MTPLGTRERIKRLLDAYGLPTQVPQGLSPEALASTMALDKKASGHAVNVVLLTEIGACTSLPIESSRLARML